MDVAAHVAGGVVVLALSAVTGSARAHPLATTLVLALAVLGCLPWPDSDLARWRPVLAAAVTGATIAATVPDDRALLPFIVVPALTAGLLGGWRWAVTATGATSLTLLARGVLPWAPLMSPDYLLDAAQWSLLALSVGLLGAWTRRIELGRDGEDTYAHAARLLVQLRDVARELSAGLDSQVLATQALHEVQEAVRCERATFLLMASGGAVTELAHVGRGRTPWETDVSDDGSAWQRARRERRPVRADEGLTPASGRVGAVVSVVVQGTVGLVGVERPGTAFSDAELQRVQRVLDDAAVRLDAAGMFDEVRAIATTEERRRVAREIHDGIAQELAALGYRTDDLAARAASGDDPAVADGLVSLREELSRVIAELRLSIFDLRSEVGQGLSLTAALAEQARAVGRAGGLVVHLDLAESPQRLRVDAEAELLRIAQEAMTNARRHAQARNLWVTCHVDPPSARLSIADDGRGLSEGREDSYGLQIMRERAGRIGATLSVREHATGGVVVEVQLCGNRTETGGGHRHADRVAR